MRKLNIEGLSRVLAWNYIAMSLMPNTAKGRKGSKEVGRERCTKEGRKETIIYLNYSLNSNFPPKQYLVHSKPNRNNISRQKVVIESTLFI